MPTPFFDAIRRLAVEAPERPSLTVGEVTLTRAALVAAVERVAAVFAERGVGEGSWVTLAVPNGIEFVEAALAAWLLGGAPQPVARGLPPAEREAIIALADPALVVAAEPTEAGGRPVLSAADIARIATDPAAPRHEDAAVLSPEWKVVTSGGSTGRPKLIVTTSPADADALRGLALLLRLRPDGTTLVTGPMSHNAPYVLLIAGLLLGNHMVVMPRFDAVEALRLVERHGVDWLYLVPTMMLRIWRLPEQERLGYDVSSLRIAFHMAALGEQGGHPLDGGHQLRPRERHLAHGERRPLRRRDREPTDGVEEGPGHAEQRSATNWCSTPPSEGRALINRLLEQARSPKHCRSRSSRTATRRP